MYRLQSCFRFKKRKHRDRWMFDYFRIVINQMLRHKMIKCIVNIFIKPFAVVRQNIDFFNRTIISDIPILSSKPMRNLCNTMQRSIYLRTQLSELFPCDFHGDTFQELRSILYDFYGVFRGKSWAPHNHIKLILIFVQQNVLSLESSDKCRTVAKSRVTNEKIILYTFLVSKKCTGILIQIYIGKNSLVMCTTRETRKIVTNFLFVIVHNRYWHHYHYYPGKKKYC